MLVLMWNGCGVLSAGLLRGKPSMHSSHYYATGKWLGKAFVSVPQCESLSERSTSSISLAEKPSLWTQRPSRAQAILGLKCCDLLPFQPANPGSLFIVFYFGSWTNIVSQEHLAGHLWFAKLSLRSQKQQARAGCCPRGLVSINPAQCSGCLELLLGSGWL